MMETINDRLDEFVDTCESFLYLVDTIDFDNSFSNENTLIDFGSIFDKVYASVKKKIHFKTMDKKIKHCEFSLFIKRNQSKINRLKKKDFKEYQDELASIPAGMRGRYTKITDTVLSLLDNTNMVYTMTMFEHLILGIGSSVTEGIFESSNNVRTNRVTDKNQIHTYIQKQTALQKDIIVRFESLSKMFKQDKKASVRVFQVFADKDELFKTLTYPERFIHHFEDSRTIELKMDKISLNLNLLIKELEIKPGEFDKKDIRQLAEFIRLVTMSLDSYKDSLYQLTRLDHNLTLSWANVV